MNNTISTRNREYLYFQRNIFAALTVLLGVSLVVQSCFLFSKRERIVITPPVVEKSFWVERDNVSPTYIEQFGVFLGQLLLGKSSGSSQKQRDVVLRHCSPGFYPALREKLIKEEEMLKKQNASYVFYPTLVRVDPSRLEVLLSGDRLFFSGGKQVSSGKESYRLKFIYDGGRLLLDGVNEDAKS